MLYDVKSINLRLAALTTDLQEICASLNHQLEATQRKGTSKSTRYLCVSNCIDVWTQIIKFGLEFHSTLDLPKYG